MWFFCYKTGLSPHSGRGAARFLSYPGVFQPQDHGTDIITAKNADNPDIESKTFPSGSAQKALHIKKRGIGYLIYVDQKPKGHGKSA
jgi:hypothetical protein